MYFSSFLRGFQLPKIVLDIKSRLTLFSLPSGPADVQWTSIERPYWTCGRLEGTFNGRLVDVPNET